VHVDAYRLASPAELDDLDLDYEGSIVVVEWAAGMLDGVADSWLRLRIARPSGGAAATDPGEAEPREVTITGHGPRFADFRL
jgi:tRNA A37 threonylcarbamoyladenosine biosynthesis protein TsaE